MNEQERLNIVGLYGHHTMNVDTHTRLALIVHHHATGLAGVIHLVLSLTRVPISHCYLMPVNISTPVSLCLVTLLYLV